MFVANMKCVIKDTKEHPIVDGMVETLDEMLTTYGVTHFFSECSKEDLEKDEDAYLTVFYDEAQNTVFDLVYMLWMKTTRNCADELIHKAMVRIVTK